MRLACISHLAVLFAVRSCRAPAEPTPVAQTPTSRRFGRDAVAADRTVPRRPDESDHRRARRSRMCSTRRRSTAACGRRPTSAARGRRSSTISRPARSAPSPSRRRIRTSSTSAAAKGSRGRISRSATASTNRPTPERRGRISACAMASRFRTSSSTRATPTGCSSPCSAIHTDRATSAASIDRPTAASTFEKVLSKDENTGASDLEFDPTNPDIVYACLWEQRQGPWENGAWAGTNGGIFKSTDGGTTWRQLTRGLPRRRRRAGRHRDRAERRQPHLRDGRQPADGRASIDRTMPARAGRGSRPTRGPPAASAAAICRCRRSIRRMRTP